MPHPHSPYKTWDGYEKAPRSELEQYLLLGGHVSPGIVDLIGGQPDMITMLRDPIERVVSHYKYLMRHEWWVEANPHAGSLAGFLSTPKSSMYVDNTMCRYIGTNIDAWIVGNEWKKKTPAVIMEWSAQNEDIERVFERAMRRMDDFFFVGLKEKHHESVEMFLRKVGFKTLPDAKTIWRANHLVGLTQSDLDLLYPFIKYDAILHQKAKEAFEKEYGN